MNDNSTFGFFKALPVPLYADVNLLETMSSPALFAGQSACHTKLVPLKPLIRSRRTLSISAGLFGDGDGNGESKNTNGANRWTKVDIWSTPLQTLYSWLPCYSLIATAIREFCVSTAIGRVCLPILCRVHVVMTLLIYDVKCFYSAV
jgi:hypothetical protein